MTRWTKTTTPAGATLPPQPSLIDPAWYPDESRHTANLRWAISLARQAHKIDSPALFEQAMHRPTVTDTAPWPVVTAPGTGRRRPKAQLIRFGRATRRNHLRFLLTAHRADLAGWFVGGFALGLALAIAIAVHP